MNKLTIIGNLTADPELRVTTTQISVCSFTVAVNRKPTRQQRENNEAPGVDFFRVTAWRERGELCAKFLQKGKKVCVIGPVSVNTYTASDGSTKASLEILADEIEFLSPRVSDPTPADAPAPVVDNGTGYTVVDTDDLLF